ncbi:cytochrome-c oxidase [Evansella clarkii]|uniref:cytochrome-c oxidase n=1 Tax=Evansella clarkii TaxID=79879 RepID=UPI0015A742FF|nr:cytochrome-c oxidase [Evansella clarkii]
MGYHFIRISVLYFVVGVLLGLYMSMTYNFSFTGVHAHVNLLGWTSMTLAGILYVLFPKAGRSILGKIHFILHNIGLLIMMVALFTLVQTGYEALGPVIGIGGISLIIGVILFAINIFRNMTPENLQKG